MILSMEFLLRYLSKLDASLSNMNLMRVASNLNLKKNGDL